MSKGFHPQRAHPRYQLRALAELNISGYGIFSGLVINISRGGFCMGFAIGSKETKVAHSLPAQNSICSFTIEATDPKITFGGTGVIRWSHLTPGKGLPVGVGIQFSSVNEERLTYLLEALASRSSTGESSSSTEKL